MTNRKMTDGERIAITHGDQDSASKLAKDIDRIIRRRMAEAWDEAWFAASWYRSRASQRTCDNPYRGRKRKT